MLNIFKEGTSYTCKQVADKLQMKEPSIRYLIFHNKIPSFKCGRGRNSPRRLEGGTLNKWLLQSTDFKKLDFTVSQFTKKSNRTNAIEQFEQYVTELNKKEV